MNSSKRTKIATEQRLYQTQQGRIYKPDVYGIRRQKVRPPIHSDTTDDFDDIDHALIQVDSDSMTAAELLIQKNPQSNIPACLIHQIYSILPNHTTVDRELQEAFKSNLYRKFHVTGALEDEFLLMKTSDYDNNIIQARSEAMKDEHFDLSVFDRFKDHVQHLNEVTISKDKLIDTFGMNEKHIAQLVSFGLLLPHTHVDLYWFSVRGQGTFMSKLNAGRAEIIRMLRKRHTHNIMEKLLLQKKMRKTNFSMEFLLYDLVGSGRVERHSTPMGDLIQLTTKGGKN
ncbi:Serine/threonine-protein kinase 19 [Choanephora cucurbitarum]|uniref:Serine/threonine-protein kinase 19 n=1 Tax=Choanephora cucurbitarum TaxID=101091 RepID=A0A1C7NDG3_9FUNG|nr:Serine/threonine-protein kinase 19 [Choanephora cucurbitarum]